MKEFGIYNEIELAHLIKSNKFSLPEYLIADKTNSIYVNGYNYTNADEIEINFEILDKISKILTKDFYYTNEIIDICRYYIDPNLSNADVLSTVQNIGFKIFPSHNCIIKGSFTTPDEYFISLFTTPFVDIFSINKELINNSSFNHFVENICKNRTYIEYSPYKYISTEFLLMQYNISENDILKFCDLLLNNDYDFFNMNFLRTKGFSAKISNIDFDDYFYDSILRNWTNTYSYTTKNRKIVFSKNKDFSFAALIEYILRNCKYMHIDSVLYIMESEYDIVISKKQINAYIDNTNLSYNNKTQIISQKSKPTTSVKI